MAAASAACAICSGLVTASDSWSLSSPTTRMSTCQEPLPALPVILIRGVLS